LMSRDAVRGACTVHDSS